MVQYDNAANYRIDRIMNIRLLDTPAKPKSRVKELEKGLNLQEYMYQNLNMFTSDPVNAEFVIPESAVSLVIDFFGKHVSFCRQKDGTVSCRLKVSAMAMKRWAVGHANIVKVVSPDSLVKEVREEIRKAAELYGMKEKQGSFRRCCPSGRVFEIWILRFCICSGAYGQTILLSIWGLQNTQKSLL